MFVPPPDQKKTHGDAPSRHSLFRKVTVLFEFRFSQSVNTLSIKSMSIYTPSNYLRVNLPCECSMQSSKAMICLHHSNSSTKMAPLNTFNPPPFVLNPIIPHRIRFHQITRPMSFSASEFDSADERDRLR